MANGHNEGIQQTGGSMVVQNMAVGRGAQVIVTATAELRGRGQDEVARRLEELVRQLEAHAHQVPDIGELRGATTTVADELAKEQPNKTTVTSVLSGIADSVRSVSGLATAADALLDTVRSVF